MRRCEGAEFGRANQGWVLSASKRACARLDFTSREYEYINTRNTVLVKCLG